MTRFNQTKRCFLPAGLALFLYFIPSLAAAQIPGYERTNGASIHNYGNLYLEDLLKSTKQINSYTEVKGHPFYYEDWRYADMKFRNGREFGSVRVKVNLYSQEFICLGAVTKEITLRDGIMNRLVLYDTSESGVATTHIFRSDIPMLEKDSSFPVFEVLAEGKAELLDLRKKKIVVTNDAMNIGSGKEFVSFEDLYVYFNGELKKIDRKPEFYVSLFSDQKEKVESYIQSRKLKCKEKKDAKAVVEYYNSL